MAMEGHAQPLNPELQTVRTVGVNQIKCFGCKIWLIICHIWLLLLHNLPNIVFLWICGLCCWMCHPGCFETLWCFVDGETAGHDLSLPAACYFLSFGCRPNPWENSKPVLPSFSNSQFWLLQVVMFKLDIWGGNGETGDWVKVTDECIKATHRQTSSTVAAPAGEAQVGITILGVLLCLLSSPWPHDILRISRSGLGT